MTSFVSTYPRRGFSLIELLVVIGIIALLIGILLPVLAKVRSGANAAKCLANMRSLAQATSGYTTDNKRFLPQPNQDGDITDAGGSTTSAAAERLQGEALWFNALDYYLGQGQKEYSSDSSDAQERNFNSFKQDPVWNDLPVTVNGSTVLDQDDVRTIKMNAYFGHGSGTIPTNGPAPAVKFYKVTSVPLPGNTVLYGDGRAHDTPAVNTGAVDATGARSFSMREAQVGLRHDQGANLAKADASAAYEANPIKTGTGTNQYQSWYDNDDDTVENRPDAIFNFRPEDFTSSP